MSNIDYTKLNDRIVEQAYETIPNVLTKEDMCKLIDGKVKRARLLRDSYKSSVIA